MRTKFQSPNMDEIIAFIVFILCCLASFFHQTVQDVPFTLID